MIESVFAAVPVVSRWANDDFGATKKMNPIKRRIEQNFRRILIPRQELVAEKLRLSNSESGFVWFSNLLIVRILFQFGYRQKVQHRCCKHPFVDLSLAPLQRQKIDVY